MEPEQNAVHLKKILELFCQDTLALVEHVLTDQESDRHYSAVTAGRRIHAYNDTMRHLDCRYQISNVSDFLQAHGYAPAYIKRFEIRMEEEMPFYYNHNLPYGE